MNYKEKYEMALEGIQEILSSGEDSIKMSRLQLRLQGIFPELKESEDERIRKDIIVLVKDWWDRVNKDNISTKEQMIAWLEKQGNRVVDEELSKLLNKVICRFINDPNIPYSERDEVSKKIVPYVEHLEKQGEQKSIDNLTQQEAMDIAVAKCFNEGEQKSAWSEEDETYSDHVITAIKSYYTDDLGEENPWREELLRWLKSLRPQSTWKPSKEQITALEWQKEHLWKSANGDDLPEIDREVVAFQETFPTDVDAPSLFKIVIAHRPNPKGYDGKSVTTGKVEHYTPKTYDKGGWNIPNVVLWLDLNIPNLEED